jgi:AraC-like DNA-binding protein
MWSKLPEDKRRKWDRQWFGDKLVPEATFRVRGIGIREPMFNANVDRPLGTGDWLIMLFHQAPRLDRGNPQVSNPPKTLILWPPGEAQFYSFGKKAAVEPHSWMHVEGTWVAQQVKSLGLPTAKPIQLADDTIMTGPLTAILEEMRHGPFSDSVILQNLFENWARCIRRQILPADPAKVTPSGLIRVRRHLDGNFSKIPPLDELAEIAAMSRSHLCHQFRKYFDTTISEYVIRKRMAAAQRMLFEIDMRPGEIAEAVGYPDIYQFSKQFKKTFGVSPTAYRQSQITNKLLTAVPEEGLTRSGKAGWC